MLSQPALRTAIPLALLLLFGGVPGLDGRTGPRAARAQAASQPKTQAPPATAKPDAAKAGQLEPSEDQKAIHALDEAFTREYNNADSKALAARFTEDAEITEADGARYEGRALIEQSFADTFAANKGVKLALEIDTIRLLSPSAAKEEGRVVLKPAAGSPVSRLYTVLYVKRDGRWLIASVREESDPFVPPHDRLSDLAWMLGDWVDEGPESVVHANCRWSEDKNFLIRTFTVKRQGKPVLTVTQRIGWDPLARQVRSWEFDSEGGFGEGKWTRDGERWIVKHTGVRPDGATASATNVMARERPDLIRWTSTDRIVGDESLPSDEVYALVHVPPAPGMQPKTEAAPSSPNPNTTRSPR